MFAADAGPMGVEWSEGPASRCIEAVRRSTVEDTTRSVSWLLRENVAKRVFEEAGRRDLFGDKTESDGSWRSTQVF